ncbi:MAG: DMT family transporter [Deltaproteobacteria bacterium]|nr:DMT family transporter [Deltaproteobacteria bacterium]
MESLWLVPTLMALAVYGLGQGLVKQYSLDVPPARYCLYFFFAKLIVYGGYYVFQDAGWPFEAARTKDIAIAVAAYVLEGLGWICYYESIVAGPITIVGTLSAAYAAPTVLFAYIFLGETLAPIQYVGVTLVIAGCAGVSYAPASAGGKVTSRRWMVLAAFALLFWGGWQTLVKYSYQTAEFQESQMGLFSICGAFLTLFVFGALRGRREGPAPKGEIAKSAVPMGMMAGGDLGVLIATKSGPVSVVTAISGAYPLVTLGYAWFVLKERITTVQWVFIALVIVGMYLSPGDSPGLARLAAFLSGSDAELGPGSVSP